MMSDNTIGGDHALQTCIWMQPREQDDAPETEASSDAVAFIHDVHWGQSDDATRGHIARVLRRMGIATAMGHWGVANEIDETLGVLANAAAPRILALYGERFGIIAEDFLRCDAVDFRLLRHRRSGGGWGYNVPASTWSAATGSAKSADVPREVSTSRRLPAELRDLKQLPAMIGAWRSHLPTGMRIMATTDVSTIQSDLPFLVQSDLDVVVIHADQVAWMGMPLARMVHEISALLRERSQRTKLWVVPPPMSIEAIAKLRCLGADAVALDHRIPADIRRLMQPSNVETVGLAQAVQELRGWDQFANDRPAGNPPLASIDPEIAKAIGIPYFQYSKLVS